MPMIQSYDDHLRVDVDYISLKDCFEAFRRGVEHRDNTLGDILLITNSPDTIEYQTSLGDSYLITYDPIHKVMVMRAFLRDDDVLKPLYIYNQREYQIACEFLRSIMHEKIDLKGDWLV